MHDIKENVNALSSDTSQNKTSTVCNSSQKQLFNKNSIRKQKRLCQIQKRLALFNEEDMSELEVDDKEKQNELANLINNFGLSKNKNLFQKKSLNINDIFNNSFKISLQKNTVNYNNNKKTSYDKNDNKEELTIDKNNSVYDDDEENNTAKIFNQDSTNDCIFADIVNLDSTDFKNVNIIDNFDDSQEKKIDIINSIDFEETPKTDLTNINKISNENQNNNNLNEDIKNDNDNNEEEDNVELNISNLELDINQFDSESNNNIQNDDFTLLNENSNEFAKKYLSTKSKSFIKFNNNLTARVAAQGQNSSPSYMLALCPELIENSDKKNMIKENYAVTDAISEEIESDTFTPRQSNNLNTKEKEKNVNKYNNSLCEEEKQLINISDKKNATDKKFKKNNHHIFIQKNPNKNNKTKIIKTKICNNANLNIKEPLSPNICNNNSKIILNKNYTPSPSATNKLISYYSNNAKSVNSIKQKLFTTNENIFKNNYINNSNIKDKTIYIKNSKIIIRHKKAKSLIFNNNLNTMNIYGHNTNMKSKNKNGASADKKKSSIIKINNNTKNKSHKVKIILNKDIYETENINKQKPKKYFSNDHFTSSTINNTTKKKVYGIQRNKYIFSPKSKQYINTIEQVCQTEKSQNTLGFMDFITKSKKCLIGGEPIIHHSKQLSQQFNNRYKLFPKSEKPKSIGILKNKNKDTSDINVSTNINNSIKLSLSNYSSFKKNKNKYLNTSTNHNNSITSNKISHNKIVKFSDNLNTKFYKHNKSKTSFVFPSYFDIQKFKPKTKPKNKFNEIQKNVDETLIKIVHKKINTIGNSNELTKILNMNINNKQLKKSASNNNLHKQINKHKIMLAMQRIKFMPLSNYSKALNELYKSKKNLFVLLVYKDTKERYVFRGLYEVNTKDKQTAHKLFAPDFGQAVININNINYFYNYQSNMREFVRIKYNNEDNKKFNADTVIVY